MAFAVGSLLANILPEMEGMKIKEDFVRGGGVANANVEKKRGNERTGSPPHTLLMSSITGMRLHRVPGGAQDRLTCRVTAEPETRFD